MFATIDSNSITVDTLRTERGYFPSGQLVTPGTGYAILVATAHDTTGTATAFDTTAVTAEAFLARVNGVTMTIAAAKIAQAAATYDPANPLAQIEAMTAQLTSRTANDSTVANATAK